MIAALYARKSKIRERLGGAAGGGRGRADIQPPRRVATAGGPHSAGRPAGSHRLVETPQRAGHQRQHASELEAPSLGAGTDLPGAGCGPAL